jgi:hypothetical protein
MNPTQYDNVIEAAKTDVPAILGDLHESVQKAAIEAMTDDGSGKVSVGFALKIDYTKSPPEFAFEGASSVRTKITGPRRVADETPELPGLEGGDA